MEILDFVNDREVSSMDNIVRFGMERVIKSENLSGHSWWVTLFSYLITEKFCQADTNRKNAILLKVLIKALTHDMDEMFTDDISHAVKYNKFNGDEIKSSMGDYAWECFSKKFANVPQLKEAVKHHKDIASD